MNKAYYWFISPILAGLLAWGLSGNWQLGLWLLIGTGIGSYVGFKMYNRS